VPISPHRIALATCAALPAGDEDDAGLPAALGGDTRFVVWDDPAVDWSAFDLVVVRSTWDYQERRDAFVAWAQRVGDGRLVNRPAIIAWNTDKRYVHELEEAGLPVVHTMLVEPGEAFAAPGGEYVVKPTVSAGSRDTARFARGEEERAAALVAAIHASGRTAMVQPYVTSVDARGETAMLFFGGRFSHAIHKGPLLRPGAEPTDGLFAPETIFPREPSAAELKVAERVVAWTAERFGGAPPAYSRVDLVEDAAGDPVVLELELTEPSLFFAHGRNASSQFAEVLRAALTGD